jgi:flavodoxin
MKTLVVFYSRTGNTKKVAGKIWEFLQADFEEIFDTKKRAGALGYLLAGQDATLKRLTKIKEIKNDPSSYDLVIIGTPGWAFNMSAPIRTYISQNKEKFEEVAFFCTLGDKGGKRSFKEMEKLCKKKPIATLGVRTKEVIGEAYFPEAKEFVSKILKATK